MPRFSLTQLLMATALVAILLAIATSKGCVNHNSEIESIGFLSGGKELAVADLDREIRSHQLNRTLRVLNTNTGKIKSILDRDSWDFRNSSVAWNRHGLFLYCGSTLATTPSNTTLVRVEDGNIVIRSTSGSAPPRTITVMSDMYSVAMSPDETKLAVSIQDHLGTVDIASGNVVLHSLTADPDDQDLYHTLIAISEDNTRLARGTSYGAQIVDAVSGTVISRIRCNLENRNCPVHFVPGRSLLAIGMEDGAALYDVNGQEVGKLQTTTAAASGRCRAIAVSRDGSMLAAALAHGIALFDVDSKEQVRTLGFDDPSCVAFTPDGKQLAVGDLNGDVTLYDITTDDELWRVSLKPRFSWAWTVPYAMLGAWLIACIGLAWRRAKNQRGQEESQL